jgi:hypothetical protein
MKKQGRLSTMTGKRGRKPKASKVQAFLKNVDERIAKHGRMIVMVGSDAEQGTPGYAYTVGLTERGLPEVVAFGLGPEVHTILNDISQRLMDGKALPRNERLSDVFKDLDAVLQDVPKSLAGEFLRIAFHKYGDKVQCLQLVWPDACGRMPWEAGHDPALRRLQPLLAIQ